MSLKKIFSLILKLFLVVVSAFFILILILMVYLIEPESEEDRKREAEHRRLSQIDLNEYIPNKYGKIDSIQSTEKAILVLLKNREPGFLDYRVKWYFINQLISYKEENFKDVIRLLIVIYLESTGAATTEDLGNIFNECFAEKPEEVIDVLVSYDSFIAEKYNSKETKQQIIRVVAGFPYEMYERGSDFIKLENLKMRKRLQNYMNKENSEIILYMLEHRFK